MSTSTEQYLCSQKKSLKKESFFSVQLTGGNEKGDFFILQVEKGRASVFNHYLIVMIIFASELCSG